MGICEIAAHNYGIECWTARPRNDGCWDVETRLQFKGLETLIAGSFFVEFTDYLLTQEGTHESISIYLSVCLLVCLSSEIIENDLEATVEPVSGNQFVEDNLKCAITAGWVQSKHIKAPAVNILQSREQSPIDANESFHVCRGVRPRAARFITGGSPWGSLRRPRAGLAGPPCRPSWTSWRNEMFMLSQFNVWMLMLSSDLVLRVFIEILPVPVGRMFKGK